VVTGALAGASSYQTAGEDGKPVCWQGRSPANLAKTAGRGHGKSLGNEKGRCDEGYTGNTYLILSIYTWSATK